MVVGKEHTKKIRSSYVAVRVGHNRGNFNSKQRPNVSYLRWRCAGKNVVMRMWPDLIKNSRPASRKQ